MDTSKTILIVAFILIAVSGVVTIGTSKKEVFRPAANATVDGQLFRYKVPGGWIYTNHKKPHYSDWGVFVKEVD